MTDSEQRQVAILNYSNLMRIKSCNICENKELDYQIRVAKQVLAGYGVDLAELEY